MLLLSLLSSIQLCNRLQLCRIWPCVSFYVTYKILPYCGHCKIIYYGTHACKNEDIPRVDSRPMYEYLCAADIPFSYFNLQYNFSPSRIPLLWNSIYLYFEIDKRKPYTRYLIIYPISLSIGTCCVKGIGSISTYAYSILNLFRIIGFIG